MACVLTQICLISTLLVLPSQLFAQGSRNPVSVSGLILSEGDNQRIQHVEVHLCDGGGNLLQQTTTNDSGEFYFRSLQRAPYILTFDANGFRSQEMHLDLSFMSDRGMTIYLKPLEKNKPAVTAAGNSVSAHELSMGEAARNLAMSGRRKLYGDKNAQAALDDFQQAVSKAPGYYEAYCDMAMAYVALSKSEDAQASFRKAIEVSHDSYGDAYIGLGTMVLEKGDQDAAEKALQRGVQLNPSSWRGFYELGKLELGRDHLDPALQYAQKAKLAAPNVPITYRLLANIHMRQKNYPELLNDLDAYIRLDPDSPAGARAAEMRQQVAQQIAKEEPGSNAPTKP